MKLLKFLVYLLIDKLLNDYKLIGDDEYIQYRRSGVIERIEW